MKLTENINLAGLIFTIDEDAYLKLQNYLNAIERYFGTKDERDEIMADIESRIAELFQAQLNKSKEVISLSDLDRIIDIIGKPEDFASISDKPGPRFYEKSEYKTGRLFRDIDKKVLGGVCSGLGVYYNVDPVILRVLFVLCLGLGSLLVYVIFWIVLPPARSLEDRYEMKGYRSRNLDFRTF
ncbi:MAG: PspC domain-containing protein [Bacteroidales bacterium]